MNIKTMEKRAKGINWHFTQENIDMASRHRKRCLTSLVIRDIQNKCTMRNHYAPTRMDKIKYSDNSKCWQACGETRASIHTAEGNAKGHRCSGNQCGSSL